MVTERLMQPGQWDLALIPETPKVIRDVLQPFGHLVIHEARIDPRVISDANLLSTSLYVGVLRRKPTPYQLSGASLLIWLGDEEGKGQMPETVAWAQNITFAQWVNFILTNPATQPITVGSITAVGAALLNASFLRNTQRFMLDFVMQYFTGLGGGTAEYRVNNNGTLDAGLSTVLFKTTPTSIVMPREGGRETGLAGIEPTAFSPDIDADSYTTRLLLVGGAGVAAVALGTPTTYKDIHGNLATLTRLVNSPQTAAGQETTVATAQLALYPLRQVVTLTTDHYDVPHDIRAGDYLYVYDPEHDLVDLTNPQRYRGAVTYPLKLRAFAITWPIESGMAVYYRDGAGVYTDLTPWVEFDPPGTSFELGASLRGLTVP